LERPLATGRRGRPGRRSARRSGGSASRSRASPSRCPGRPRSARGGSAPRGRRRGRRPSSARRRPARRRGGSRSSPSVTCPAGVRPLERRRLDRAVAHRHRAERRRREHVRGHDRQARTRSRSAGQGEMPAWPPSTRSAGSWSGTPSWSPASPAYSAYRWRERPPWLASMAWMLEALLGLPGGGRAGRAARRDEPAELRTHLGYLMPRCACAAGPPVGAGRRRTVVARRGRGGLRSRVAAISVRMVMTL
jgi:hypothetical protein